MWRNDPPPVRYDEAEWQCQSTTHLLKGWFQRLRPGVGQRKMRLVAARYCQWVIERYRQEHLQFAIDAADQFADGTLTDEERRSVRSRVDGLVERDRRGLAILRDHSSNETTLNIVYMLSDLLEPDAFDAVELVERAPVYAGTPDERYACIRQMMHDIVEDPFRPVLFSDRWRTTSTTGLARTMYDARDFDAMPILADALQDAGCEDDRILAHCRGPGPHVRGCWVVDRVLGME